MDNDISVKGNAAVKIGVKSLSLTLLSVCFKRNRIEAFLQPVMCRVKEWRVTLGVTLAVSAVSSFVPV